MIPIGSLYSYFILIQNLIMMDILQLVAISSETCVHAQACPALCNTVDCSCLAPLFVRFPRQYWNGLPFPPPGVLPDLVIEPMSLASPAWASRFLTSVTWEASMKKILTHKHAHTQTHTTLDCHLLCFIKK